MPGWYEIRWLPENRTEEFVGSRGHCYVLSESDHLDLDSMPVWCHRCGGITNGEKVPSLEQIDQEIRDLGDPSSRLYQMTENTTFAELFGGDALRADYIAKLQRRRRWRQTRKSPPKCIICGSTEIILIPDDTPIPNPAGNGEIQIVMVGMCSSEADNWLFTPEGDRIPQDPPSS